MKIPFTAYFTVFMTVIRKYWKTFLEKRKNDLFKVHWKTYIIWIIRVQSDWDRYTIVYVTLPENEQVLQLTPRVCYGLRESRVNFTRTRLIHVISRAVCIYLGSHDNSTRAHGPVRYCTRILVLYMNGEQLCVLRDTYARLSAHKRRIRGICAARGWQCIRVWTVIIINKYIFIYVCSENGGNNILGIHVIRRWKRYKPPP